MMQRLDTYSSGLANCIWTKGKSGHIVVAYRLDVLLDLSKMGVGDIVLHRFAAVCTSFSGPIARRLHLEILSLRNQFSVVNRSRPPGFVSPLLIARSARGYRTAPLPSLRPARALYFSRSAQLPMVRSQKVSVTSRKVSLQYVAN